MTQHDRLHSATVVPNRRRRTIPITLVALLVTGSVANWTRSASATGSGDTTFVPVTPCRLFDTRPGQDNVGPRSSPLAAGDTFEVKVTGEEGGCGVPGSATAIAINATAVGATAPSFATFFPTGEQLPVASNLNYVPGQPPLPNKVDVAISTDGRLSVYNAHGEVHMIADVTGYYRPDRLEQLEEAIGGVDARASMTDVRIDELETRLEELDPAVLNFFAHETDLQDIPGSWTEVASVTIPAVGAGTAVADYWAVVREDDAGGAVFCAVAVNTLNIEEWTQVFASGGFPGNIATLAGIRPFSFATPGPHQVRVMCMAPNGHAQVANVAISVDYRPTASG